MALELVDSHGKQIEPVLLTHFGDGATPLTNRDIALDLKVLTDLTKATLPNNMSQASSLQVAAAVYGYNDSGNIAPVRAWSAGDDGNTNSYAGLATYNRNIKFNGVSWDRQRNNAAITALASAARSADTDGTDLVNYDHKGIVLFVNASAFAGDDTFKIRVEGKDPISGTYYEIFTTGELSTTGLRVYEIHPNVAAASGGVTGVANRLIPRTWRVVFDYTQVTGTADTITASVAASYVP